MDILKPTYQIIYAGKDVTKDFSPILESISFKEYLENKAAEVELSLFNDKGFFFGDWYPDIDDRINIKLGYESQALIDAGNFYVDDITLSGSRRGDMCNIRAMSARSSSIYSPIRKQNEKDKSLSEIVNRVATELGYTVKGDTSGSWSGIQNNTGLAFLEQLARETGRILKIEGADLIFFRLADIKAGAIVGAINKGEEVSYTMTDKAAGRISKCTVKSWRKKEKILITGQYDAGIEGGGSITIWDDCADTAAANQRAKNYVEDRTKEHNRFSITLPGDVKYRAGVRLTTSGFGQFSKTWYVAEASHTIDKSSGYLTKVTLQK